MNNSSKFSLAKNDLRKMFTFCKENPSQTHKDSTLSDTTLLKIQKSQVQDQDLPIARLKHLSLTLRVDQEQREELNLKVLIIN